MVVSIIYVYISGFKQFSVYCGGCGYGYGDDVKLALTQP